MSEHQQNDQSAQNEPHVEYYGRRAARRQRLAERRAGRFGGSWVVGAVLILVGILIMFPNLTTFSLQNWWALFILIPAVGAFGNAWRTYQSNKRISAAARGSLIGGLILTMVAAVFLLNLNWTILGPVLLILGGLGLLANTALPG